MFYSIYSFICYRALKLPVHLAYITYIGIFFIPHYPIRSCHITIYNFWANQILPHQSIQIKTNRIWLVTQDTIMYTLFTPHKVDTRVDVIRSVCTLDMPSYHEPSSDMLSKPARHVYYNTTSLS